MDSHLLGEGDKGMEEGETSALADEVVKQNKTVALDNGTYFRSPLNWFRMLSEKTHWSFVFGVIVISGISQGLGGGIWRVSTDYYWKDAQKVQPSEAQIYQGIVSIPWIVRPLWGLLTDVLPVAGYRRRPYISFAGILGVISALVLSLPKELHVMLALLALAAGSAGVAMATVTIEGCIAQNSIDLPSLAADMQSLNGLCASIGGLLGFSISGFLIHAIGSQGVLGLLSIPAALVFAVGIVLKEPHIPKFDHKTVWQKFVQAIKTMWTSFRYPNVWRPCIYMYMSLALSLNIHEGMFYWYTDRKSGPSFSQEMVGFISSFGSIGSLLGVLLYQNMLKDYPFRSLLFWTQLLSSFSGMLDLILVFRLNLKYGIPDYFFVVIDESVSEMVGRIKLMPLLVLSLKICPSGVEGTFYALLMSINNVGMLTSSWGGGLLIHMLKVTRTEFSNLWIAILIRNILRVLPLALLCLVPNIDHHSTFLPDDMLMVNEDTTSVEEVEDAELRVSLVGNGE